jgi:hypothetical protein
MAQVFTELTLERSSVRRAAWIRRAVIAVFAVIMIAALLNAFGQRASTTVASSPAGTLRVRAPERVRGGLFFQTRIDVEARRGFERPRLVLDPGVVEGMQVSSIEPAATDESSRDGRVVLSYPPIIAGERLRVWLQFQVDPTAHGGRGYGIELDEGTRMVLKADRDLTVLP